MCVCKYISEYIFTLSQHSKKKKRESIQIFQEQLKPVGKAI